MRTVRLTVSLGVTGYFRLLCGRFSPQSSWFVSHIDGWLVAPMTQTKSSSAPQDTGKLCSRSTK